MGRFPTSPVGPHEESRYRHAAFMAFFYDLYALVGTSGSRRSVSRSHSYRAQPRTASPRGRLLAAFRSLTCVVTTATRRAFGPRVIRTRIRPLAGAECAPNSNRGRAAGTAIRDVSLLPAAPKRAMRILRLRKIVLLKPAARSKWRYGPCGWFQKDTLRVSVVRYDGCAARASGIQLSVYRVSADRTLLEVQERPRDEKDDHCAVTFPLILDLSDLECRSSASGVPERTKRWRIAFSVTP